MGGVGVVTFTLHSTPLGWFIRCDRCRERYLSDFRDQTARWAKQHVCERGRR